METERAERRRGREETQVVVELREQPDSRLVNGQILLCAMDKIQNVDATIGASHRQLRITHGRRGGEG